MQDEDDQVEIRLGCVDDLRIRGQQLLHEHWLEVCTDTQTLHLNPDWEQYETLLEIGRLFLLCLWVGPELAGYSATFLTPHLHYRAHVAAMNDVIFVAKPYRNGLLGLRLIRATEKESFARGAHSLTLHAKPDTSLSHVLDRAGYKVVETLYRHPLSQREAI